MDHLKLIEFNLFKKFPEVIQAFSTRAGGVSKAPFNSLNLGLNSGDHSESVQINRKILFDSLDIDSQRMVYPQQIHSSHVEIAEKPGIIADCDAIISDQTNLYLSIQTADCFPVFLFDRKTKCIGLVHAGWRGVSNNILRHTIFKMKEAYVTDPFDLFIGIGPGIQQRNYQIDLPVAKHFDQIYLLPDGENHFKLNLQKAIIDQLRNCGVSNKHMECIDLCTFERSDLFYSYRREGKKSGRMMGLIGKRY